MADGAGKLLERWSNPTAGINTQVGTTGLEQGLSSANNPIKISIQQESKNAETLVGPLSLSKTDDHVPVNGIGMAPYMISVALLLQHYQQI